jgi:DUF1680 family protein
MISSHHFNRSMIWTILFLAVLASSCSLDPYQRRANVIKDHVEGFYAHLKANRVDSAIRENQQIEAMADEMAGTIRKQARLQGTTQVEREFALMKTARETSAQNWMALGQYFVIKQQTDKARALYQRVVDSYTNPTERLYREQAARALKDLDIIAPPASQTTPSRSPE